MSVAWSFTQVHVLAVTTTSAMARTVATRGPTTPREIGVMDTMRYSPSRNARSAPTRPA